jgi:hypothetical protein
LFGAAGLNEIIPLPVGGLGSGMVAGRADGSGTRAVCGRMAGPGANGVGAPPADGSGVVGGRAAARRCICEVIAREMAAEVALGGLMEGSGRVAGRCGAGSVVSRNCAVGGRAMLTGGLGASEPGVTLAGRWIVLPLAGVVEEGPSVSRIWPVAGRRGGMAG